MAGVVACRAEAPRRPLISGAAGLARPSAARGSNRDGAPADPMVEPSPTPHAGRAGRHAARVGILIWLRLTSYKDAPLSA